MWVWGQGGRRGTGTSVGGMRGWGRRGGRGAQRRCRGGEQRRPAPPKHPPQHPPQHPHPLLNCS